MSVVIIGGNERVVCQYEDICKGYGRIETDSIPVARVRSSSASALHKALLLHCRISSQKCESRLEQMGDGEWMRDREAACVKAGAGLACEFVICQEAPDNNSQTACKEHGAPLV